MPAGVRKIPTAMIPPITAEVVEASPSSRRKPCGEEGVVEVAVVIGQEFDSMSA
jgi:hypothetical protein